MAKINHKPHFFLYTPGYHSQLTVMGCLVCILICIANACTYLNLEKAAHALPVTAKPGTLPVEYIYASGFLVNSDPEKGYDFLVVKYNSAGQIVWVKSFDKGSVNEEIVAARAGPDGKIILAGNFQSGYNLRGCLMQLDTNANLLWYTPDAGQEGESALFLDVASDNQDHIYIAGNTGTPPDCTIKKFNYNTGAVLPWPDITDEDAQSSPSYGFSYLANGLTIDRDANLYVTGATITSDWDSDLVTLKYSAKGYRITTGQWPARHTIQNSNEEAKAITLDPTGRYVYVTGISDAKGNYDIVTRKYDLNGNAIWPESIVFDIYNREDLVEDLAPDSSGNIYLAGSSFNGQNFDSLIVKYDPDGRMRTSTDNELWPVKYGNNMNDTACGIALNKRDDCYVTGKSEDDATSRKEAFIVKYNNRGSPGWFKIFNAAGYGGRAAVFNTVVIVYE